MDSIDMSDSDFEGDLYEYMWAVATAGQNDSSDPVHHQADGGNDISYP